MSSSSSTPEASVEAAGLAVEVAVVGGGPAGLTAAIALAAAGVETALISESAPVDHRTTALMSGSVAALEALGVWPRCRERAAALEVMRIVDDRPSLLRAPEVAFEASEIGLAAFGYNIENRHLLAAFEQRACELPSLKRVPAAAETISFEDEIACIRLAGGGDIRARLVVGADGRNSLCRTAAGIAVESTTYPQTALTLNLRHTRPHRNASTEFHTAVGPFTLVPLARERSSLVWVTTPERAEALMAMEDAALADEVERQSHSILGKITVESGRGSFPLAMQRAQQFAANRVALIGEAAHVIPPIGAQGLNLGLRDAATIAEIVIEARRYGGDVGAPDVLARYDAARRADVGTRALAVDLLNRSLLADFLPLHGLRWLGLYALDRLGPLRRAVMREGVAPRGSEPRLMRGETL
jgi:2-octaprenyl-6-methoxyphenol hydroxylase